MEVYVAGKHCLLAGTISRGKRGSNSTTAADLQRRRPACRAAALAHHDITSCSQAHQSNN